MTDEELEYCVRKHEKALSYIPNQTEHLCELAVDAFPDALQYVRNQTRMICMTAVRNSGNALRFVRDQTEEICYAAVERDGEAIQYVRGKKSTDLCLAAVWENPDALAVVLHPAHQRNHAQLVKAADYISEPVLGGFYVAGAVNSEFSAEKFLAGLFHKFFRRSHIILDEIFIKYFPSVDRRHHSHSVKSVEKCTVLIFRKRISDLQRIIL